MRVGELEVIPLSDGSVRFPPTYFSQSDWGRHAYLAGDDGRIEAPIGCFLVRTRAATVLVDAGLGPRENEWFRGGELPAALEAAGVAPDDVDLVVCTHLHFDHIGWLVRKGQPWFPKATVRFGAQDWDDFVESAGPEDSTRGRMEMLNEAGRVELIHDDGEVAPGVSTLSAPGHTRGHRCVVVSSGDRRAFLLGDAVACPIQLEETEWEAISDVDPALAKRTREALWRELEGSADVAVAAHFPGLQFNRVLLGEGKRYFA